MPPPANCFKLNYDGASRGNPSKFGAGIVIMDSDANIVKESCKTLLVGMDNKAELESLNMGLDLARYLQINSFIIEGDSMVILHVVSSQKTYVSQLQYLLDKVLIQLKWFNVFSLSHCYKEANSIADYLANKAIDEQLPFKGFSKEDFPLIK